jgi:hypothetical protein
MAGHSRSKNGVASLARSRSKNGVASLAYGPGHGALCGLSAGKDVGRRDKSGDDDGKVQRVSLTERRTRPGAVSPQLADTLKRFESSCRRKGQAMPPLIAWGVGLVGGAALVRWAIKEAQRINRELEDARLARMAESMQTQPIRKLRRDPVTGAYRPE